MTTPRYPALISALPATVPFVGPEQQERSLGRAFSARLGANESGFGPSPKAVAAMQAEAQEVWKYADPSHVDLKGPLAASIGVAPENVVIGEGIDGLLGYTVRLLIEAGDAVVTSDGAYPTFNYHVAGFGGILHKVPYRDDAEDLEALIAKATDVGAKLIYFANPDNPMGTWRNATDVARALEALPEGCVLALDEAYVEFAPEGTVLPIDPKDDRVVRFRTFSKGYGMAGARVGYAIGEAGFIQSYDKIRNHFGMNRIAMAGAEAALTDPDWLDHVRAEVAASKARIGEIAVQNGLTAIPSATNFVAVDCGRDGAFAKAVLEGLAAEGVFVRMPFVAPQNRCIRISAGPEAEMEILAAALPRVLATLG